MRNPFDVEDVLEPKGEDVEQFARSVEVPADASADENALAWVTIATADPGLPGAWTSRRKTASDDGWRSGVATLRVEDDRVFILYKDSATYLIEASLRGERLVGRYVNLNHPSDTSPWLGVIVDNYRIDGFSRAGRWDLRRCRPAELPEPIIAALVTEARQLGPAELRELVGFARYLRWKANDKS